MACLGYFDNISLLQVIMMVFNFVYGFCMLDAYF